MAAGVPMEQLVLPTWAFAIFVVSIVVAGAAAAYRIVKLGRSFKKVEGTVSAIDKKAGSEEGSDDEDDEEESEDESGSADKVPETPKDIQKLLKAVPDKNLAKKKSKKEKQKKVTDDDWEWPVYDECFSKKTYRNERKLRVPEKKNSVKEVPFEVTYEQRRGWPNNVFVTLFSKYLIQAASKFLPDNKQLVIENPKIHGQDLFHALQSVRSFQFGEDEKVARCHLRHLLRFLETEYKDTIVHVERMGSERMSTWELLWAFLYKGQKAYYTCSYTGQRLLGIVHSTWYTESMGKILSVTLEVRDYDGSRYRRCYLQRIITEFNGEKSLNSLGVCPLRFVDQRERLEGLFLANGKKFHGYATQRNGFMQHRGPRLKLQLVGGCWQLKKRKADGRVMVDLLSFARTNPGYPLDNAEPSPFRAGDVMRGTEETEVPSDEDLMLAPAVVFGFSFAIKEWGCFDINGLSEIHFDDQAFDRDLVLTNATQKQMLLGLVSQYLQDPADEEARAVARIDPISSKGEGCIFLCYGPPGTGKTLTAESVAEKLHRPLWSVSVFELGTKANDVETSLLEILDIASQWRAVLLLDEADIYLEKRTSNGDPNRSAMTAIFLRLLEYYRGVLFLTTNRVSSFDDAFCSRISMFLRYHRLGQTQREKVWGNFLGRAGLKDVDLQQFTTFQLNGREIRNTIRIAQTWTKSSKVELTGEHVLQVVQMLAEFRGDLEGAISEEADEEISSMLAKVTSMKADEADERKSSNALAKLNSTSMNGGMIKVRS